MAGFFADSKKRFLIVFAVLLCASLAVAWRLSCVQDVQAYKYHNVIRFHVLANSDSPVDQAIKYQVRDVIVGSMAARFGEAADVEQARRITLENLDYIQQLAVEIVRAAGKDYPVTVEMGNFPFPAKTYHTNLYNFTLPAGNYEAVRVVLGRGAGANWWCVLFPPLCFVGPGSCVPVEKKAERKNEGGQEEVQLAGPPRAENEGFETESKGPAKTENKERKNRESAKKSAPAENNQHNERGDLSRGSRGASSAAVPAFKLEAPEALVALSTLEKDADARSWTMTAAGEQVQFRFKILDFFHQSGSWLGRLLGVPKADGQN